MTEEEYEYLVIRDKLLAELPHVLAEIVRRAGVAVLAPGGGSGVPPDGSVTPSKLSFDPATQAELDAVAAAKADVSALAAYLLLSSVSLTPSANIVPRAGVGGKLAAGFIPYIDLSSMVTGLLAVASINATGTRDATTVLHGDGTWHVPTGSIPSEPLATGGGSSELLYTDDGDIITT